MSSWKRSPKSLDADDGEKARKDNNRVAVTRAVEAHRNPDRRERRFVVMAGSTTCPDGYCVVLLRDSDKKVFVDMDGKKRRRDGGQEDGRRRRRRRRQLLSSL